MSWPIKFEPIPDVDDERSYRRDALQMAVDLRGEAESQPVFRDHELDEVISDARRFFEWIMNGDKP